MLTSWSNGMSIRTCMALKVWNYFDCKKALCIDCVLTGNKDDTFLQIEIILESY